MTDGPVSAGRVQTVDATPAYPVSWTPAAGALTRFDAEVHAVGAAESAGFAFTGVYRRAGAAAPALVGVIEALAVPANSAGATLWAATFEVAGNAVRVKVTGAADTVIDWLASVTIREYAP